MRAEELMTRKPATVTPDEDVRTAAQLMAEHDCGCLPVVDSPDNGRVIGVVTDRDVTLRAVGQGRGADTKVNEVMSRDPVCCGPGDDADTVERLMADKQVRRVVIVDDAGCCVGIVAQADLARVADKSRAVTSDDVAHVVEKISQPNTSAQPGSRR